MRNLMTGAACAASLLLAGCAGSLETRPNLQRTEKLSGAMRGVSYTLPKAQYKIKVARMLVECPGKLDKGGKATALRFNVEVGGVGDYVPGESYTIAYEALAGLMRTANFEIKYWPNGNLKSIGAGAEDKTSEVIRDTLKTGFAILSATAGMPVLPSATSSGYSINRSLVVPANYETAIVCSEAAQAAVDARTQEVDKLDDLNTHLTDLKNKVEDITTRANLKLATLQDRRNMAIYAADIRTAAGEIAAAKKRQETAEKGLTLNETLVWDTIADEPFQQVQDHPLSEDQKAQLRKLLEKAAVATANLPQADAPVRTKAPACYGEAGSVDSCLAQNLNLQSKLVLSGHLEPCADRAGGTPIEGETAATAEPEPKPATAGLECAEKVLENDSRYYAARDNVPDSGVFIREMAYGQLFFCRSSVALCNSETDLAKLPAGNFPQLGQLRYLPLKVGPFQAREMLVSLTQEGRIEAFSYKSTKAAAQGFAASAADAAGQLDTFREKRETEERDDLAFLRSQVKADRDEIAYQRSETAYQRAETAFERNEAAAILQAEITRMNNQNAFDKLLNPPAPAVDPLKPVRDETTALEAEVALLKARLARIQAEAALSQAQR